MVPATPIAYSPSVGPVGLEPTTYGLKVRSSAIELEAPAAGGPGRAPGQGIPGGAPTWARFRGVSSRSGHSWLPGNRELPLLRSRAMTTSLMCPKCGAEMRHYERNRVLVDQCTGCGGLFLDRGELEALVAAENAWHAASAPAPSPQDRPQQQPYAAGPPPQGPAAPAYGQQPAYGQPPVQHYGSAPYAKYSKQYGHRKRRSFLSDLFDD